MCGITGNSGFFSLFGRKRLVNTMPADNPDHAVDSTRRTEKEFLHSINGMAASGNFNSDSLDSLSGSLFESGYGKSRPSVYYLASLYLQLGRESSATAILRSVGVASSEMKWFAAVMIHSLTHELPLPRLSRREFACLKYLQQHLLKSERSLSRLMRDCEVVAVLGNAPGARFEGIGKDVHAICFNGYRRNPRIVGEPQLHVVTPSWKAMEPIAGQHLCITGNSIFHRRSKVWRRFMNLPPYDGIHVTPRQLWCELNMELNAPPSAGAVILGCLARNPVLPGKRILIGGFSSGLSDENHSYDRVPLSKRHNWLAEVRFRQDCLNQLDKAGARLDLLD
ncbi:hypothetical protein AB833_30340 [Chromatiales bacterium (ex Bugula neritina AB1)]|nr:hypothetical protein AB833_30340 [Chromatiales bacterium (ex Bugula neritina AB1)]